MAGTVEYQFRIHRIKPGEMTLLRLGQYIDQLARLLGSAERVHFGDIVENCTTVVALVDVEAKPVVSPRVRDAAAGRAKGEAAAAYRRLNEMVSEDGTVAELPIPGGEVIPFSGRPKEEPEIGPLFETTVVQGMLTRLQALSDGRLGFSIQQPGGDTESGDTTSENAAFLAPRFLTFVRATGRGKWRRDITGRWMLDSFQATHFDEPAAGTLAEFLSEARQHLLPGDGERMLKALRDLKDE